MKPFRYQPVQQLRNVNPINKDAEMALRWLSLPILQQAGAVEAYANDEFLGYVGILETDESFNFWMIADKNITKHIKSLVKVMTFVLESYANVKPAYVHVMDGNQRFLEYMGFKPDGKMVEYAGLELERWKYDGS